MIHEVRPDGRGHNASGKSYVAIIVKADPDHAEQIGRETSKPAIARRARFSGSRQCKAASTHACAGTFVQDVFEDAGHEVGDTRVQRHMRLRSDLLKDFTVGADDIANELRLGASSDVRKGGVSRGYVHG